MSDTYLHGVAADDLPARRVALGRALAWGAGGTLLAMVYLVVIVAAMTVLMKLADRFTRPRT